MLRLDELGILEQLHADLCMTGAMAGQFAALRARRAEPAADHLLVETPIERLYIAIIGFPLPTAAHKALQERVGLRNETQRLMRSMEILHRYLPALADPNARPSQIVQILDQVLQVSLALMPIICQDMQVLDHISRYRERWQHIQPELSGDDLRRMGIPRGTIYRAILAELRIGRLDGTLHSRAEETALAESLATVQ